MCVFPYTVQTYQKMFSKLFLKYTRKLWNEGYLLSALGYIVHIHLRVPHGYQGVQHSCQDVLIAQTLLAAPITTTNCPKLLTY